MRIEELQIGDTVRATYRWKTMNGIHYSEEIEGVILAFPKRYSWRSKPDAALVRCLSDQYPKSIPLQQIHSVIRVGCGEVIPGVTYPFSDHEYLEQARAAFQSACLAHDYTHQGWTNPATFLAALYLRNERRAYDLLSRMRRKDGSLNPNRVRRLFEQLGLSIDAWAFEQPVSLPRHPLTGKPYNFCFHPVSLQPNWTEIANSWFD